MQSKFLKHYGLSIILIVSILFGAAIGFVLKEKATLLKPFGDVFLNLLFTVAVPLVFFSLSSAIASMSDARRLGKIFLWMVLIFVGTGIISSSLMVLAVKIYPPTLGIEPKMAMPTEMARLGVLEKIIGAFTVSDFTSLLSKKNMLALIVFSLLVGLATLATGKKGKDFAAFLTSANEVMMKLISYIMFYAPIGLGAYFAYLVGVVGPELMGSYVRAVALYYPVSILYFFIAYSIYAFSAGGWTVVSLFWPRIITPSLTALGTGSSVAAIPTNLQAADEIGVPKEISKIVVPIGATIHMDGTCISAILKIAMLFGFFGMNFWAPGTILSAIGVALLSGIVMSGITGGGFLGEMLIVTLYGFPPEALPLISMVGTLVDPPATMVNATGDNVVSMMVARIIYGKDWRKKADPWMGQ